MSINFASLGTQFFQETSEMMLIQPEPQHFFARMLYAAEAGFQLKKMGFTDADMGTMAGTMARMGGVTNSPYPEEVFMLFLAAHAECAPSMIYVQDLAKGVGDTIDINRPVYSVGGLTLEDRTLKPDKPIDKTTTKIAEEQNSITLVETGGPQRANETKITPLGLNDFPSQRSVKDLRSALAHHLGFDRVEWLERVIAKLFGRAVSNVLYPSGYTADNDFLTSADGPMDYETITRVQQRLTSTHVPPFANGHYKMLIDSAGIAALSQDPLYTNLAREAPSTSPLFPGRDHAFVSTIDRMDLYTVETLETITNASSVKLTKNVAFGRGAIGVARGMDPKICPDDDTDFQRRPKVIWRGVEGFTVFDERFLCEARTTGLVA